MNISQFKFFRDKRTPSFCYALVEYTTEHNSKSIANLKFAYEHEIENTDSIHLFNGTFTQFKNMVDNDPNLDWFHNRPLIHKIRFFSQGRRHYKAQTTINFYRRNLYRFKKRQELTIFYERL